MDPSVANSNVVNGRSKNVDVKYQMIKVHIRRGTITLEIILTLKMEAAIMTKALPTEKRPLCK